MRNPTKKFVVVTIVGAMGVVINVSVPARDDSGNLRQYHRVSG